jgi:guanylate kinase
MTIEPTHLARRGLMFVLSSPSGAGKSTIARQLLADEPQLQLSISVTTRERRASELEGVHYLFIDSAKFDKMAERGDLLEWAQVHGNFYGTPREPVEDALRAGRDVLFDIDWQGTDQLYEKMPADLVRVFVLPPSMAELKARLERRAEDSQDSIARRLDGARVELEQWAKYDYVIVNDDLERALASVKAIMVSERLRRDRVLGLRPFVSSLLQEAQALAGNPGRSNSEKSAS